MCTVLLELLVKHMCYTNNNSYFWSFDALDFFKLNVGSYFRLLCSLSFMAIFLLSMFYYCIVAW
jgi:hypothetical protein